jgi:omega-6 fatty acid desaturase (delta-12 desaturase)
LSEGIAPLQATARRDDWRSAVHPYVGPNTKRASIQLVTTLVPLALLMWLSHVALPTSPLLAGLLVLPIAGLLVRTFIFMHDCAHGSFFSSRAMNDAVGAVTGVLTLTPFAQWRRDHALHHASSGDLDRRGHGDILTLTVREYLARPWHGRLAYRIVRHPALLLLGGPIHLALNQRVRGKGTATGLRQYASVWSTNLAIALVVGIALVTVGWQSLVVAYALPYYFAAMAGVWLFYVQHQFEDAYWTPHDGWSYVDAALRGSSHLRLSPVLQWFTGSIGLHHVHHVAPKIPNYRLQRCHDANPLFHHSPVVTIRSGTAALRLALWDEDQQRLVRFRDVTSAIRGDHAGNPTQRD